VKSDLRAAACENFKALLRKSDFAFLSKKISRRSLTSARLRRELSRAALAKAKEMVDELVDSMIK
jgi:hypothetical protein